MIARYTVAAVHAATRRVVFAPAPNRAAAARIADALTKNGCTCTSVREHKVSHQPPQGRFLHD